MKTSHKIIIESDNFTEEKLFFNTLGLEKGIYKN